VYCINEDHKHDFFHTQDSGAYDQASKQQTVVSSSEFVDEATGIRVKPISNQILDVEDLIYNSQFHKSMESKELQQLYLKI